MKVTEEHIRKMKGRDRIAVLTCYDYTSARAFDGNVEVLLVGDSLAMVVYGFRNTLEVGMDVMLRHVAAVSRGSNESMIIADMPYRSYDSVEAAAANARAFVEAGADAVKIEGNRQEVVRALVDEGIPVLGHIGLTPQTILDFKVQGKNKEDADRLVKEAEELDKAGCFALVLECIPAGLAEKITGLVRIPTIGIGAGRHCDGQVLVVHDMLGLFTDFRPRFVRRYADLAAEMKRAVASYARDVKEGSFPSDEESFH